MHLTPRENERLQLFTVAELARRRRARGRRLNTPEAIALICDEVLEAAWDGLSMDEVIAVGRSVLTEDDVLEGVSAMVPTVQVEALFPSGTSLVAVDGPIGAGSAEAAPSAPDSASDSAADSRAGSAAAAPDPPGAVRTAAAPVRINEGRRRLRLTVRNTGETAVYVSSHYPLGETNAALSFDREAAAGMRLDIPAGTALVFEPGGEREVELVEARK
ncbi:urea amidohydrolase [Streptomyces abyssalis]|uniref:urease n=1 Tax=Streptomyces abyssalis TaxID=933944 RepID=A0A1E7JGJ2_9ACTN|nr:urease subunit gamma [Streptomyces abyssalis]OEU85583.1 urea amidohydrolase [Streptomyces abyssalis]OEU92953.1 urea amidohydrolase [Streptomyces abyssalis]OEV30060.1 urea amidohydrolase [Streptomyces nanshensis]